MKENGGCKVESYCNHCCCSFLYMYAVMLSCRHQLGWLNWGHEYGFAGRLEQYSLWWKYQLGF